MLHSRQTHYDIVVPCFFPFSLMMQKIFEKLCVLSKWRLKDWKKRKGKKRKEIYTHSSNNIAHSRSMPKYSTCCRACKQIMFWEHQGSFTAKALKFLFYLSFCRMNSMRPFVYTRVQVSFKITLTFIFYTVFFLGIYRFYLALLYWPHNDHSSEPHSVCVCVLMIFSQRLHSCFIRRFDIYTSLLFATNRDTHTQKKLQNTHSVLMQAGKHSE